MTIFTERPLSYLNTTDGFLRWQREVGPEEAKRQLTEATRAHMQEHGNLSVLDIVERMDDVIAVMEEHSPDIPDEEDSP